MNKREGAGLFYIACGLWSFIVFCLGLALGLWLTFYNSDFMVRIAPALMAFSVAGFLGSLAVRIYRRER